MYLNDFSSSSADIMFYTMPNRKFLLDGLEKIKTRGYDGAGLATMAPHQGSMVRLVLVNIESFA
jgi:glucosamine 6-phosphate synthetase-like amidotransferase/phosphosugar isomerase protein